jgi:Tfp pilus assembly protein FimT
VRKIRSAAGFTILETLLVVGLIGVISAIAVPMFETTVASYRLVGSARSLTNTLAVAKIRAASSFTRARVVVDLGSGTHHVELWDKTAAPPDWVADGGSTSLPQSVTFGFGPVSTPPPNAQVAVQQALPCKTSDGDDIAGTSCVIFNSRGVPIDSTAAAAPIADDVLYVTDGSTVYAVTVAATGMVRLWQTFSHSTPAWTLQ